MSFLINNINLDSCGFNGNEVNSIYYNNVLVWQKFSWPGWDAATWEDIYNLCQARQNGAITADEFKEFIGTSEKIVTLSTAVQGSSEVVMIPESYSSQNGTIQFVAKYTLLNSTTRLASTSSGVNYPGVAAVLTSLYENCNIQEYTEKFSLLTEAQATTIYPTATERIKTTPDGTARSWWISSSTSNYRGVSTSGTFTTGSTNVKNYVAPAFVIG